MADFEDSGLSAITKKSTPLQHVSSKYYANNTRSPEELKRFLRKHIIEEWGSCPEIEDCINDVPEISEVPDLHKRTFHNVHEAIVFNIPASFYPTSASYFKDISGDEGQKRLTLILLLLRIVELMNDRYTTKNNRNEDEDDSTSDTDSTGRAQNNNKSKPNKKKKTCHKPDMVNSEFGPLQCFMEILTHKDTEQFVGYRFWIFCYDKNLSFGKQMYYTLAQNKEMNEKCLKRKRTKGESLEYGDVAASELYEHNRYRRIYDVQQLLILLDQITNSHALSQTKVDQDKTVETLLSGPGEPYNIATILSAGGAITNSPEDISRNQVNGNNYFTNINGTISSYKFADPSKICHLSLETITPHNFLELFLPTYQKRRIEPVVTATINKRLREQSLKQRVSTTKTGAALRRANIRRWAEDLAQNADTNVLSNIEECMGDEEEDDEVAEDNIRRLENKVVETLDQIRKSGGMQPIIETAHALVSRDAPDDDTDEIVRVEGAIDDYDDDGNLDGPNDNGDYMILHGPKRDNFKVLGGDFDRSNLSRIQTAVAKDSLQDVMDRNNHPGARNNPEISKAFMFANSSEFHHIHNDYLGCLKIVNGLDASKSKTQGAKNKLLVKVQEAILLETKERCFREDADIGEIPSRALKWWNDNNVGNNVDTCHTIIDPNLSVYGNMIIRWLERIELYALASSHHHELITTIHMAYDAYRYDMDLHANQIFKGTNASSKSWLLKKMKDFCIPGLVESLSGQSSKSRFVDGARNFLITIMEELQPELVMFDAKKANSAETNFKELLTSMECAYLTFEKDDVTGVRYNRTVRSEQVGTFFAATNWVTSHMSESMKARFHIKWIRQIHRVGHTITDQMAAERHMDQENSNMLDALILEFRVLNFKHLWIRMLQYTGGIGKISMETADHIKSKFMDLIRQRSSWATMPLREGDRITRLAECLTISNAIEHVWNVPNSKFFQMPFEFEQLIEVNNYLRCEPEIICDSIARLQGAFFNEADWPIIDTFLGIWSGNTIPLIRQVSMLTNDEDDEDDEEEEEEVQNGGNEYEVEYEDDELFPDELVPQTTGHVTSGPSKKTNQRGANSYRSRNPVASTSLYMNVNSTLSRFGKKKGPHLKMVQDPNYIMIQAKSFYDLGETFSTTIDSKEGDFAFAGGIVERLKDIAGKTIKCHPHKMDKTQRNWRSKFENPKLSSTDRLAHLVPDTSQPQKKFRLLLRPETIEFESKKGKITAKKYIGLHISIAKNPSVFCASGRVLLEEILSYDHTFPRKYIYSAPYDEGCLRMIAQTFTTVRNPTKRCLVNNALYADPAQLDIANGQHRKAQKSSIRNTAVHIVDMNLEQWCIVNDFKARGLPISKSRVIYHTPEAMCQLVRQASLDSGIIIDEVHFNYPEDRIEIEKKKIKIYEYDASNKDLESDEMLGITISETTESSVFIDDDLDTYTSACDMFLSNQDDPNAISASKKTIHCRDENDDTYQTFMHRYSLEDSKEVPEMSLVLTKTIFDDDYDEISDDAEDYDEDQDAINARLLHQRRREKLLLKKRTHAIFNTKSYEPNTMTLPPSFSRSSAPKLARKTAISYKNSHPDDEEGYESDDNAANDEILKKKKRRLRTIDSSDDESVTEGMSYQQMASEEGI